MAWEVGRMHGRPGRMIERNRRMVGGDGRMDCSWGRIGVQGRGGSMRCAVDGFRHRGTLSGRSQTANVSRESFGNGTALKRWARSN